MLNNGFSLLTVVKSGSKKVSHTRRATPLQEAEAHFSHKNRLSTTLKVLKRKL